MDFSEFVHFIFFLLIFDIFILERLKSEDFSFFMGGLVSETTISPPSIFPGDAPAS